MNNADLIVATLKAAGIARGFGIPSGNVLPLMEAMRKGGVEFVLTAHEGSAGFAADVTGRMTGAPGPVHRDTLGPGATNLTTGVGCAFLDRSPLIAITCNLNTDQLGRRIQMWIDHHALFKPITKATLRLEKGRIGETVSGGDPAGDERAARAGASRPAGRRGAGADQRAGARRRQARQGRGGGRCRHQARGRTDRRRQAADRGHRLLGDAACRSDAAAQGDRAPQPALRHHHHGQGPDRRGPPAVARLHRARLPAGAAALFAFRRPDRRARLRHDRGRIRGLDRRRPARRRSTSSRSTSRPR